MNKNLMMTLVIFSGLTCSPVLSANSMTVTQKMLKPLIQYQCNQELKQSKLWKVSTYLMTDENKSNMQKEVCDCVSDNALNEIPTTDLVKATVSDEAKKTGSTTSRSQ